MKVILHADDFGYNVDTLNATIECFERGALTSASIMVNCEAADKAFAYARQHPEFSFGVHLTYGDEQKPVLPPGRIPSLVDNEGRLGRTGEVRRKAMLMQLPTNQIAAETQAQIDVMENAGVRISHLDSHGHLHKCISMILAMKKVHVSGMPVSKVRGVQNVFVNNPSLFSVSRWVNALLRWVLKRQFRTVDYFYMSANSMDTNWADAILRKMDTMADDAIIEIGVHPGFDEEWRRHEYKDIIEFAEKLRAEGKHEIINWNNI